MQEQITFILNEKNSAIINYLSQDPPAWAVGAVNAKLRVHEFNIVETEIRRLQEANLPVPEDRDEILYSVINRTE